MTDEQLRVEINRLQIAKRNALKIADERSKENVALRKALEAAKEFADDEFSNTGDLNRKNRISALCDKIDAALASDVGTAGSESK